VRYRGGDGTVKLSLAWRDYVWKINQPRWQYQFTEYPNLKNKVGWCNKGAPDVVEQVTFSGNLVSGVKELDRVWIDTYDISKPIPPVIYPVEMRLDTRVQMLSTQFATYLDMTTNGRNPRTLLLTNPGERVYMEARYLAPVTMVNKSVKVTAFPTLRVRGWPSTTAATMRFIPYSVSEYVQFYTVIGADIWGRVAGGWIALKYGGKWMTDFRV